jgi:hypothetical protein
LATVEQRRSAPRRKNTPTEEDAMNPNPLSQIDIAYVVFAMAPTLRRLPERRPDLGGSK